MTNVHDLMRYHVEALFIHDRLEQLHHVNEPGGVRAPRFFLGRTTDGAVIRFRDDVRDDIRRDLDALSGEAVARGTVLDSIDPSPYEAILGRAAPVQRTWTGPAFCFPLDLPTPTTDTVAVTNDSAHLLRPLLESWIPDVNASPPMLAIVVDERAVSVCCSVRRTGDAHEAGVETLPAYRGRGYAGRVATAWARAVREMGRAPLYSTSWGNTASRAVAQKLGLIQFGSDLHIT